MRNAFLLMKYDSILHGKAIWRMKGQFLLFAFVFAFFLYFTVQKPEKIFLVRYYSEDNTLMAQVAIDNFIKDFHSIATVEKLKEYPKTMTGDVFVHFPEGFAEKWQFFEPAVVKVHIVTKHPIYQILLKESFEAYETILMASQSVISAYNEVLFNSNLGMEEKIRYNQEISLDFISLAFNRNRLLESKPIKALPAALTKEYYFYGFSLFLGILLSVFSISYDINKRKIYQRFYLTEIKEWEMNLSSALIGLVQCMLFAMMIGLIGVYGLTINTDIVYYIWFGLFLWNIYLLLLLISSGFLSGDNFQALGLIGLFVMALMGGLLLPISLLPANWMTLVQSMPFYQGFLYLIRVASSSIEWHLPAIWLLIAIALLTVQLFVRKRRQYA